MFTKCTDINQSIKTHTIVLNVRMAAKGRTNTDLREKFILPEGASQSRINFVPRRSSTTSTPSSAYRRCAYAVNTHSRPFYGFIWAIASGAAEMISEYAFKDFGSDILQDRCGPDYVQEAR